MTILKALAIVLVPALIATLVYGKLAARRPSRSRSLHSGLIGED